MSLSSTLTSICIDFMSVAMMKRVGAWKLAWIVWPASTFRWMTVPSIGDVIVVYSRFFKARFRAASADWYEATAAS